MAILNTSQRKQLAQVLTKFGFAPEDFALRNDASTRACEEYGDQLTLKGSRYYFRIFLNHSDWNHEEFWLEFSPAHERLEAYKFSWTWDTVLSDFEIYLKRLKQEIALEDPWGQPGVARVVQQQHGQKLIPAGNEFTGQRLARIVFATAKQTLDILDPYIGPELFDRLDDAAVKVPVRVLTSTKAKTSDSYISPFKKAHPNTQLRVLAEDKLHDRFIIIDDTRAYHVGHSIKDLGKKDTNVSPVENVEELKRLFEERWAEAKPFGGV